MKLALVSSFVPFIHGGGRFIVEWAEQQLREHGHEVERFYLPFSEEPDRLLDQIIAYRLMDLSGSCDRLIAFRPPAYVLPHPNKVLWFIHHIRVFYDLWDSEYRPVPDTPGGHALRRALHELDTTCFREAQHVYTNSRVVADRVQRFNGVAAKPLYPPIMDPERFSNRGYGDEVFCVCRVEPHKRQRLLVEAMAHVKTPVKLRICGKSASSSYAEELKRLASSHSVRDRVTIEDRWISEEEKAERVSSALAIAYVPLDEDSYGYPSLEGAHAEKAVVTTTDAGGVLELVEHERNGLVVAPDPRLVADAFDRLYLDRGRTRGMGAENRHRLAELGVDWSTVVRALTT